MRFLLVLATLAWAQDAPPVAVSAHLRDAVVHVRVQASPTAPELDRLYRLFALAGPGIGRVRESTGSAVLVGSPPVVLTNHHVVAGARSVVVEAADDVVIARLDLRDVAVDARADLAVLRLPADGQRGGLALADAAPPGTPVRLLGFPADGPLDVSEGTLGGPRDQAFGGVPTRPLTLTTAEVRRGLSGGPAVDASDRLVGLTVAGSEATSDLAGQGLLVPLERVRDAVQRLGSLCVPAQLGVRVDAVDGQVRVHDVTPGGGAARAGVRAGANIDAVDGTPARDPWDVLGPCARDTRWTLGDGTQVRVIASQLPPGELLGIGDDGRVSIALGAAWRLGLDEGDRITHVAEVPVDDTARLREALGRRDGPVAVRVAGKGLVILPAR